MFKLVVYDNFNLKLKEKVDNYCQQKPIPILPHLRKSILTLFTRYYALLELLQGWAECIGMLLLVLTEVLIWKQQQKCLKLMIVLIFQRI